MLKKRKGNPCGPCGDRWCANPECDQWFGSTSKAVRLCPNCRFDPAIRALVAGPDEKLEARG